MIWPVCGINQVFPVYHVIPGIVYISSYGQSVVFTKYFNYTTVSLTKSVFTIFSSLFADDTFFLKSSPNLDTLMNETNDELEKASRWFIANKLTLNVSKTKFIVFRDKKNAF